ncbi:putative hydro-lyase [Azorhizobium doebereinerae]|uniref:putative hydro-lyase n=1 Tax=Azorhizobium doebereinerae TaxID=281091 RepID=UPI000A02B695|nr:putative hydro-lyase [Azorhizobium doebereinerae]
MTAPAFALSPGGIPLATGRDVRLASRNGSLTGSTAGFAPGYVQANLAILPERLANDFLRFCQRNPKPCPLIGVSEPGDPSIPSIGLDLDIRTDVPAYTVFKDGELIAEPTDLRDHWRDDLVTFAIGCSLSFEEALLQADVPLRHVEKGVKVPMFRTSIACNPAGVFAGPMVVSMRPMTPAQAIRAVQITSRYPAVHGAPVHIGLPEAIGIKDLSKPDYGDAVEILDGEIPVFWACGVTPQSVIAAARIEFALAHAPGAMLATDLKNFELATG